MRTYSLRVDRFLSARAFVGALAALILLAPAAHGQRTGTAPARRQAAQWHVIPGGIADSGGNTAYVTGATDIVEAIDFASGQVIWEAREAHKPLAIAGNRLIAEAPRQGQAANVITIVAVDINTGEVDMTSEPIELPDWIAVDNGIGLSFASMPAVEGNELLLFWNAERRLAGGASSPEAVSAAYKFASGIARVDLTTGQTEVEVDRAPKPLKIPAAARTIDVAGKRLTVTERGEAGPDGLKVYYRTLQASDQRSGRPLWQRELASRIILPSAIPDPNAPRKPAPNRNMGQRQYPQQQQRR